MVGGTASPQENRRKETWPTAERPDSRIGHFLVTMGVMTAQQVETVLAAQHDGDARLFGSIATAMGFLQDKSLRRFADYLVRNDEQLP
jgi:hypothetical protein